eukprot:3925310-Amphidinium_carterae.1
MSHSCACKFVSAAERTHPCGMPHVVEKLSLSMKPLELMTRLVLCQNAANPRIMRLLMPRRTPASTTYERRCKSKHFAASRFKA